MVIIAIAIAAFMMFGPKPEPHPRYNTVELMHKAQKDINSLTPDERRVYNRITRSTDSPSKFKPAPPAAPK
ncbi:MAG: hypothetical protein JWQ02_30 [Capsulimonas sp.]|nr:hypothetical protein [Capsulimonas sp.]